jgi:hypothetical protein
MRYSKQFATRSSGRKFIMRTLLKPDTMSATTGKAWKFMNIHEKVFFATKVGIMKVSFGRICGKTIAPEFVQPQKDQNTV